MQNKYRNKDDRLKNDLNESTKFNRKDNHLDLAKHSQILMTEIDSRFNYEPLLHAHPKKDQIFPVKFFDKQLKYPIWISSMTGGTQHFNSQDINQNLAKLAREFGFGMGLGSCRKLIESDKYLPDFNLRKIIGPDLPFFANLGISQIEEYIANDNVSCIFKMLEKLEVDGIIIHINPLQEWFQKGGDLLMVSPLETLKEFKKECQYPIIVKEVGQGFGPMSLKALLDLKIEGIELSALGGTNFTRLEKLSLKNTEKNTSGFDLVGHTILDMLENLNNLKKEDSDCNIIISGGIKTALDGYYYLENSDYNSVFGMANAFLQNSRGSYSELQAFTTEFIRDFRMAKSFLTVKKL